MHDRCAGSLPTTAVVATLCFGHNSSSSRAVWSSNTKQNRAIHLQARRLSLWATARGEQEHPTGTCVRWLVDYSSDRPRPTLPLQSSLASRRRLALGRPRFFVCHRRQALTISTPSNTPAEAETAAVDLDMGTGSGNKHVCAPTCNHVENNTRRNKGAFSRSSRSRYAMFAHGTFRAPDFICRLPTILPPPQCSKGLEEFTDWQLLPRPQP